MIHIVINIINNLMQYLYNIHMDKYKYSKRINNYDQYNLNNIQMYKNISHIH